MPENNKKTKRTEIGTLGEFGLINHLTKTFDTHNPSTTKGIGDDAAVINNGKNSTVISTDLLIEGIHFDLAYTPLKHLGYKAVVVNLSDIYAMNAQPKQITVSVAISNRFSVEAMEEFYEGIALACKNYNIDLVGGDTTSSDKGFVISITAIGEIEEKNLVYRDGANKDDLICVSGDLGAAYLGLQLLEREKQVYLEDENMQPDLENQDYLVGRQLKPEARQDIISFFEQQNILPTSMIDISDGLSSELMHICKQSNRGAYILESSIPINQETFDMGVKFNLDPTACALSGGEDYELLFTIKPKEKEKMEANTDITIIGTMLDKKDGIKLMTKAGEKFDIIAQGWNALKEE